MSLKRLQRSRRQQRESERCREFTKPGSAVGCNNSGPASSCVLWAVAAHSVCLRVAAGVAPANATGGWCGPEANHKRRAHAGSQTWPVKTPPFPQAACTGRNPTLALLRVRRRCIACLSLYLSTLPLPACSLQRQRRRGN